VLTATDQPISSRWLVVAAWALGPAGLYGLATFAHAALVERSLTVDVAFGRSLGFWVGAVYLALPLWGFLPARPTGWYARRAWVMRSSAVGIVCAAITLVYDGLWLSTHWVLGVGVPVVGSLVVLTVAAVGTLWLAGRQGSAPALVDRPSVEAATSPAGPSETVST
jgi:hypothetical protein